MFQENLYAILRIRPEIGPKFLSKLGPKPTRKDFNSVAIFLLFILFYKRSICIIDNGANRRRTRNARFRARRADLCNEET